MTDRLPESTEQTEWLTHYEWLDPSQVFVDEAELHWHKISQDEVLESFRALARIQPFIANAIIETNIDRRQWRDTLSGLSDQQGKNLFDDSDLRYFDLYFGNDRIKIDQVGDEYSVVNGRHRLWLAARNGIKTLPVQLTERISESSPGSHSKTGSLMKDNIDISDIIERGEEQQEEAENLDQETKEHLEAIQRLEQVLQEIKATGENVSSDALKKAEDQSEQAKADEERKLEECKKKKEELLQENEQLTQKVLAANEERRQLRNEVAALRSIFPTATGELKATLDGIGDALNADLEMFAAAESELREAMQRLEAIQVE